MFCLGQWCSSAIASIPFLFFLSSSYLLSAYPTDCHDDAYEGDAYGGDGDGEERKEMMYDMLYHIHPLQCAVSCIFVTACARVLTVNCSGWNNGSTGDTMAMDDSDANEADARGYTTVASTDTTRPRQRRHLRRRLDIGCHCNSNGGRWRWRRHLTAVICDGPPLSMTGRCCMLL